MPFRMRSEIDEWFRYIQNHDPLKVKFDRYYLCLLLGLATGRRDNPTNAQEFVDDFVKDYRPSRRFIIGLMLVAELGRLGVDFSKKKEVQSNLAQHLAHDNSSNLTEKGFNCLNAYANGGFNYMAEKLRDEPRNVEEFLQQYVKLLTDSIGKSEFWNRFSDVNINGTMPREVSNEN